MDIERIVNEMSLRQKAELLTGKDFWQTRAYEEFGIPSLFLADGPHGLRKQIAETDHLGLNPSVNATCFPTAAAMANSWNEELGESVGEALGEEAAAQKVNVLLGPGINIKRNPRCGRNFEYFSEDPYLAGKMAAAYVRGIQKNGTAACIKHFACNNQEERRMVSDSVLDERTLREIYLTAFEIAVKEGGVKAVMSAYNRINGTFADENAHLLRDILRNEWGFDGVVISDWAGCNNKVKSTIAGSDLEMPSCKYGADDVVQAVENGTLDVKYVNECVKRVLRLVQYTTAGEKHGSQGFNKETHHLLAEKCAEESIVLLQNNGTLPISETTSIALIGDFADKPRYQGAGSSVVNPTRLDSVRATLGGRSTVNYAQGYERNGKKNKRLIKQAIKIVQNSEAAVLFLGLDELSEAEGLDRNHIEIPENQVALYKAVKATGKKTIVVLSCGCSVDLRWAKDADAVLYACLSGQAGAAAIVNILYGNVNPSGKLAETFPEKYEDCSSAAHFPGKKMTVEYRESVYVGYRYYDTVNIHTAYPFGHGLSYTKFTYSELTTDGESVSFKIANVGGRDGAEVAQLYVGKKNSDIFRPAKELKGFKKVFLNAGESAVITIPFDDKTFRYFNVRTNRWETEDGEYEIYIGSSSTDIRLETTLSRKGTTSCVPYEKNELPSYYSGKVADVGDGEFQTLLDRKIPEPDYPFYRRNRMIIDENCTVADLRYSKRWVGRAFSGAIRFAIKFCRAFGMNTKANTMVMGVLHQPMRGLAKYGNMSRNQLEAMIMMFNGHFFKGFHKFLHKEKTEKGNRT